MADKKHAGRPFRFSPRVEKIILDYIKLGAYIETAVAAAGFSRETFYDWLRRGARAVEKREKEQELTESDTWFASFAEKINAAVAESELSSLLRIDAAAAANVWQASAWLLERRHPERWGNRQKIQNENLNYDLSLLSNEQLHRLRDGEPLASVLASTPITESAGESRD